MMRRKPQYWTMEEMNILQGKYRLLKPAALQELLPGRTVKAIINKASRLMIRVPRISREEWFRLFEMYPGRPTRFYCIAMVCDESKVRYWRRQYMKSMQEQKK